MANIFVLWKCYKQTVCTLFSVFIGLTFPAVLLSNRRHFSTRISVIQFIDSIILHYTQLLLLLGRVLDGWTTDMLWTKLPFWSILFEMWFLVSDWRQVVYVRWRLKSMRYSVQVFVAVIRLNCVFAIMADYQFVDQREITNWEESNQAWSEGRGNWDAESDEIKTPEAARGGLGSRSTASFLILSK